MMTSSNWGKASSQIRPAHDESIDAAAEYPANSPSTIPTEPETSTAENPIKMEIWPPT